MSFPMSLSMPLFRLFPILFFLVFAIGVSAQTQNTIFLSEGKIEYERKLNLYAFLDKDDPRSEQQRRILPQFKTSYFDLLFTSHKTLFRPGRENPDNSRLPPQPAEDNIIFSDLDQGTMTSEKRAFEQVFLVQDSIRKIRWKITDETRTIAGFLCRRANAVIMDSVFVVAFYADEIIPSGGPESFSGLPGMILGIALPHQHITLYATKVEAIRVDEKQMPAPIKGKKMNNATLQATLEESMRNWDKKFARRFIEAMLI